MKKGQLKIIKKAKTNNFPNEFITYLYREDLTLNNLEIIYNYFCNHLYNKTPYSPHEIIEEVNRVLKIPVLSKISSIKYSWRLKGCLPENKKDTLFGSPIKEHIMNYIYENEDEIFIPGLDYPADFFSMYTCLLYNKFEKPIIDKIYDIYKRSNGLFGYINGYEIRCALSCCKNIKNIEILISIMDYFYSKLDGFEQIYIKKPLLDVFNKILIIIANSNKEITKNFDISKYLVVEKSTTNHNKYKFLDFKYKDFLENIYFDDIPIFIKNIINLGNYEFNRQLNSFNIYNIFYEKKEFPDYIDKFTKIVKETKTSATINSKNSKLNINIKDNKISLKLKIFNKLYISNNNKDSLCQGINQSQNIHLWIAPDMSIFIIKNNIIRPLTVKEFINLKNLSTINKSFYDFIEIYTEELIKFNVFFKDILNDSNDFCFIPLTINECMKYHNKAELLKDKYKLANNININWNTRNINVSYLILKSYPYVDIKGKEILKQIKDFPLAFQNKNVHSYKDKVSQFLQYIIYNRINTNKNKSYEDLLLLQETLPDEKDSFELYEYENNNLKILIRDYINMNLYNKKRHKYNSIKININTKEELTNRHDSTNNIINVEEQTQEVKVPNNSVFNNLRKMLPNEFEWIKTRKRLILETKLQHHCVWTYASAITHDESAIYSYVDKDGSKSLDKIPKRYTIEFKYNPKAKKYYIAQTQGRYDRANSSLMNDFILQYLTSDIISNDCANNLDNNIGA